MDVCPYAFLSIKFIYLHVNDNEYYAYFENAYLCIFVHIICKCVHCKVCNVCVFCIFWLVMHICCIFLTYISVHVSCIFAAYFVHILHILIHIILAYFNLCILNHTTQLYRRIKCIFVHILNMYLCIFRFAFFFVIHMVFLHICTYFLSAYFVIFGLILHT